jgi:hypothetical protein
MAVYTVGFWALTLTGTKGDKINSFSGEFESELEALESLNDAFREEYDGNFISEIEVL